MSQATNPAQIHDGLAVYRRGDGAPVLVFPYPHASGGGPIIVGALVSMVARCGFQAITFDPPGQYRSTRPARVALDEMVECGAERSTSLAGLSRSPCSATACAFL